MNILMLAMSMGHGGAQTHVLTLARAYRRHGHSVTVASAGGELAKKLSSEGVTHILLPLDRKNAVSMLRSVAGVTTLCRREVFDVIHAHGRIPALVARLARKGSVRVPPCVFTVHGAYDPAASGARFSRWGDRTIAVSEDIADYLCRVYHLSREAVTVIPNGIELPKKDAAPASRGRRARLDIITSSRLDRDSSSAAVCLCRLLPRLCELCDGVEPYLTVIGGGEYLPLVRKEAEKAERVLGRSAVSFVGAAFDTAERATRADLFVGTSRAALEAMSVGTPVLLAGDMGALGLLTPDRLASAAADNLTCRTAEAHEDTDGFILSELCRFAAMNEKERRELSDFSAQTARKYYDIDKIAERTLNVLRDAALSSRRDILLCGYYGAGNLGDELSLAVTCDELSRRTADARLVALTRSRMPLSRDIASIPYLSFGRIEKELSKTRLVLFGGSLFQDSTSLRSLLFYAHLAASARRRGCRTALIGGIGPLETRAARRICAAVLPRFDLLCARDAASAAELEALGCRNVLVTADPVGIIGARKVGADLSPTHECGIRDGERERERERFFLICPRPIAHLRRYTVADEARMCSELARFCVEFEASDGSRPLLLAASPEDVSVCRRISEEAGALAHGPLPAILKCTELDTDTLLTLFGCARTAICCRLHAAMLSYLSGTAPIAVDYDPKVGGFVGELPRGAAAAISVEKLSSRALFDLVAEMSRNGEASYDEYVNAYASTAAVAFDRISELYNGVPNSD